LPHEPAKARKHDNCDVALRQKAALRRDDECSQTQLFAAVH
jgi:hypothetical protein